MTKLETRERAQRTADAAASSAPRWKAVSLLPNLTLEAPIEASHAALAPCHDQRLRKIADQRPELQSFVGALCNEFRNQIWPTIGLVREDVPRTISNTIVFGGFRDAVCVSAVVAGQGLTLKWGQPRGTVWIEFAVGHRLPIVSGSTLMAPKKTGRFC